MFILIAAAAAIYLAASQADDPFKQETLAQVADRKCQQRDINDRQLCRAKILLQPVFDDAGKR